jgi:hydroxyethylthiazole kinase
MQSVTWADPSVRGALAALKRAQPFTYGLTNYVTANFNANVLLALGAAPAIGTAIGWAKAFGGGAAAMWINTATLMSCEPAAMLEAAEAAHAAGTPWVLDPVAFGAGAAAYDAAVRALLPFRPRVIRGNASEIMALAGIGAGGKGVESTARSDDAVAVAQALARQTSAVVAVSGPTDYLTDGEKVLAVPGGDARLTRITGSGCSLGATVAAMLAAEPSALLAAAAAHACFAVASERAGAAARGTASFATAFVDELSVLDPAEA